jgi:hypothetical protein
MGDIIWHSDKAKLLVDRLRWIYAQRTITIDQYKELGNSLAEIIHHLDAYNAMRGRSGPPAFPATESPQK